MLPIVPKTISGELHFITLIDDFSRFTEVWLLKNKREACEELIFFFLKTNPTLKKFRYDNGKYYLTICLENFSGNIGIVSKNIRFNC